MTKNRSTTTRKPRSDAQRNRERILEVAKAVHLRRNGRVTNSISGEMAGDFMFWPAGKHRFGWFLEPAYDYSFAGGHPQSIGMSGGLLIGIR
jgi:hypothetical protein